MMEWLIAVVLVIAFFAPVTGDSDHTHTMVCISSTCSVGIVVPAVDNELKIDPPPSAATP